MQYQETLVEVIEPISIKNIEKTQKLLQLVFPYCKSRKHPPEQSVYLSLIKDKNYFIDEKIINEEFFVSVFDEEILGTTGLTVYQKKSFMLLAWMVLCESTISWKLHWKKTFRMDSI